MNTQDLRNLYEEKTGRPWDAEDGVRWLNKNYEHLDLVTRGSRLEKRVHITLSDKTSFLAQQFCHICDPDSSISVIPFRIQPESWQALSTVDRRAFKAAIAHRLTGSPSAEYRFERVCLSFVFVCSARRHVRDLDNIAKLVMDSIKGIIMGDDRAVDHLNLVRVTHEGEEEFIFVKISESNINDHSNVVHAEMMHSWAGAEPLKIEDFRDSS
jgi:hypothetical protein